MKTFKLVSVGHIKQGENTIGNKVELTGRTVEINPDFIGYVELEGNGDNFAFYERITMKDGQVFRVSVK